MIEISSNVRPVVVVDGGAVVAVVVVSVVVAVVVASVAKDTQFEDMRQKKQPQTNTSRLK